jgi:hypothetical protein
MRAGGEMGTLYYGGGHGDLPTGFHVDDALLAHLKQVIVTKLRRGESFVITFPAIEHGCDVCEALWMSPAIPIRFVIDQTEWLPLDHDRLEALMIQANTVRGIVLVA